MRALADFNTYAQMRDLVDRLNARGYSDSDVHALLGQNMLRVFERVWK